MQKTPDNSDTQKQPEKQEFDVFVAYNSQDKLEVRAIAQELEQRSIKVWLDDDRIPPGRSFQDKIQEAILLVKSAAIFIGLHGLGKWQEVELRSLIKMSVDKNIPVIPVLLPGVNNVPEKFPFLQEFRWVSFSKNINDIEALNLLVWGITQQQPPAKQKPHTVNSSEIELRGEQFQQFHEALLSAFPSSATLKQMIRFKLNKNLDELATGENYSEVVFKLLEWAESQGQLQVLLTGALEQNPGNPKLRSFYEQIRS